MKTKTIVVRLTDEQFIKLEKLRESKYSSYSYWSHVKENNSDIVRRLIDEAKINE